MSAGEKLSAYRDPTGLARTLSVTLVLYSLIGATAAIVGGIYLTRVARFDSAEPIYVLRAQMAGPRVATGLLVAPLFVFTVVAFLHWTWVVVRNARAFSNGRIDFGPGSTVITFILPLANLIVPYLVMRSCVRASRPLEAEGHRDELAWRLRLWWFAWVAFFALAVCSKALNLGQPSTVEVVWLGTLFSIAGNLVLVLFCAAAISFIRGLSAHQVRRATIGGLAAVFD